MAKRTSVNLDMELVGGRGLGGLGTERTTETVHAPLREVVRRKRLHELAQRDFPDLTLEALEEMRRPRTYERIPAITGRPTRWIAPRGSLWRSLPADARAPLELARRFVAGER